MAAAQGVKVSGRQKRFFDFRALRNVKNCKVAGTVSQQRGLKTATVTHADYVRRGGGASVKVSGRQKLIF